MVMADRMRCIVPFCRHTRDRYRNPVFNEWICGDHWKMLPKQRRKVYGRRMRKMRRFAIMGDEATNRLWRRLVAQATETAMGI